MRLKKDSGNVLHLFSIVFTCAAVWGMALVFAGSMENLDRKEQIDLIARKYLLCMEVEGGLEAGKRETLLQELKEQGCNHISLNCTGSGDVSYGDEIVLNIEGMIEIHDDQGGLFWLKRGEKGIPFIIRKSSTAKH